MRLIGPNCMGVYCPNWGMSFSLDFPKEPGNIGVLCQSGGNAIYLIRSGASRGLRFSKGISFGNACDVNECDILEYLQMTRRPRSSLLTLRAPRMADVSQTSLPSRLSQASGDLQGRLYGGRQQGSGLPHGSHGRHPGHLGRCDPAGRGHPGQQR